MKTCHSFSIAKTVDFLFGLILALVTVGALWALPPGVPAALAHEGHGAMVIIRDDCDPNDPAWGVGGCAREHGDVTRAEFAAELQSPLAPTSVIGHQAWRNDPSYIEIQGSDFLIARNRGGRVHTFTKVENFGGGKVVLNPLLNKGLVIAPECPQSTDIPPDHQVKIEGLAEGNHRFQCCIHPWMRAIVKVK